MLPLGQRKGDALLEKVETDGIFAVYEFILTSKARSVPRGTKVILED